MKDTYIEEERLIERIEVYKRLIADKESELEGVTESLEAEIEELSNELEEFENQLIEIQEEISKDRIDEKTKQWKQKVKDNFDSEMDTDR